MKRLLTICFCCLALPALAPLQYTIGTNGRYHSSYDSMEPYGDAKLVNGLSDYVYVNPSLGTSFIGPYVDRANAFGIQVYDTIESYTNNQAVGGLVALTWNAPFVDRQNTFPMFTYDTIEGYVDATNIDGLSGGGNNSTPLNWTGAYVVH